MQNAGEKGDQSNRPGVSLARDALPKARVAVESARWQTPTYTDTIVIVMEKTLAELHGIDAAVTIKSSHDCLRDVWGWEVTIYGPRACLDMKVSEGERMSTDDSHSISVNIWSETPELALERAAATYRAAYAASVSQVENG